MIYPRFIRGSEPQKKAQIWRFLPYPNLSVGLRRQTGDKWGRGEKVTTKERN